ncbi:fam-l protein [Plasmodium malariae]|uniref:Fam-l protein n=1 Tax=Plasmodium malariae TaxID=5858 RepID=A0A1D3JGU2_PLAMA|nr:fam-l protein [Plasmodium malariae]SBT85475.1 fam-l protein [Plasmodium malariae]
MEQKIRLQLFIKGRKLIHLSWIYYFYICMRTLNESLNESYNDCRKLCKRNFRLLSKYKKNKDSSIVCLNDVLRNELYDKNDIRNNENMNTEKRKQTNSSSSKIEGHNKSYMKKKSCVFETKKYSRLEKKIFKELDYANFLKNNRGISNKIYQKIIRKKYGFRLGLPIFFVLLLSLLLLLDLFVGCGLIRGLFKILKIISEYLKYTGKGTVNGLQEMLKPLHDWLKESHFSSFFKCAVNVTSNADKSIDKHSYITGFFGFLIYFIPIFIIGVICILGVFYYHKKVKKYEKIKFKKR